MCLGNSFKCKINVFGTRSWFVMSIDNWYSLVGNGNVIIGSGGGIIVIDIPFLASVSIPNTVYGNSVLDPTVIYTGRCTVP